MTEQPAVKKISQFQIKRADDVTRGPVTPVKIAPPPATIKRSKSLKTDRSGVKRYASLANHDSATLPRQLTAPVLRSPVPPKTEIPREDASPTTPRAEVITSDVKEENSSNRDSPLPEPASWQTEVNKHRRGSSMTFVSSQNWAQFDVGATHCWSIRDETWAEYESSFHSIKPLHGFISGKQAKEFLSKTGISRECLANIWTLADMDHDGSLSLVEFAVAMHCVGAVKEGIPLPGNVPGELRDSLLFHVNNRNNLLSSYNKNEDSKSPEKSALKSIGTPSKGANVTFQEDCTLSRSRPRPSRKLVSTTPLHLRSQAYQSSSSYYSSDNSTSDYESDTDIKKRLDMTSDSEEKHIKKKHHDKKDHKKEKKEKKAKRQKSSGSDNKPTDDEPSSPVDKKPLRRERTYDEVTDFLEKLELEDNPEDAEALIQSSDEEEKEDDSPSTPSSPPPAMPSMPAPKRRLSMPPTSPPPSFSPPASSPPTSSPTSPPPSSPPATSPTFEPIFEEKVTSTSGEGEEEDEGNTSSSCRDAVRTPAGYDRLLEEQEGDNNPAPVKITINEGHGELFDSECSASPTEDKVDNGPVAFDTVSADTVIEGTVCQLTKEDMAAVNNALVLEEDELKADYNKSPLSWNLDQADQTTPDMDKLRETDLEDLRTMIRDYELHNNALVNLTRELKIELLKVREHKLHLQSTLKCMKKP